MIEKSFNLRRPINKSGFTLIEVIVVLIILGVTATFVAIKATDHNSELIAQTEILKSHLRYAQMKSMSSNAVWGVSASGNSYCLFTNGSTGTKRQLPGEEGLDVDLSVHGLSVTDFTYSFGTWGSPCTDAVASARLTLAANITVSEGGISKTITINPYTGFIP